MAKFTFSRDFNVYTLRNFLNFLNPFFEYFMKLLILIIT